MATTIEDDAASLDDFEGGVALGVTYVTPDFMPDARDIMRKFPCNPEADAGAHAFHETFDTSLHWRWYGASWCRRLSFRTRASQSISCGPFTS